MIMIFIVDVLLVAMYSWNLKPFSNTGGEGKGGPKGRTPNLFASDTLK